MKKRIILIVGLFLILGGLACGIGFSLSKGKDSVYKDLDIFAEAMAVIEKRYVDQKPTHEMIYGAMRGMLASLDAYSQFLDQEEYKDLIVDTEGVFGGVGIEITMRNDALTVVSPIEDTPAWDAGIESGDVIVKINNQPAEGISLTEAIKKLRGEPGTAVMISVLREKTKKVKDVKIVRAIIKIKDIKRAQILEDDIGYLRIAEFRENTAAELDRALTDLKKKKMTSLIIDVRNNPGGLLYGAIDVAARFLPQGVMIVSTDSRSESPQEYRSIVCPKTLDIPIIVLINKGSASGSEILAASLRDNNRAILLGETTFGKGSVQTIIPLSDGSALRLTTSKYYTPKKISIHEKGVAPDLVVEKKEKDDVIDEEADVRRDFDYKQDNQIIRALEILKSAKVKNITAIDQIINDQGLTK